MILKEFQDYVDNLLGVAAFRSVDMAPNGIQVGRLDKEVRKVACAVDACQATIAMAADWGADVLCTHHGLFWSPHEVLTGPLYHRVAALCNADMALYAVHLPLDAHGDLGNNIGLARVLKLQDCQPFGRYRGVDVGIRGTLPRPLRLEEISQALFGDERGTLGRLPFGKELNTSVGIVSGGSAQMVSEAATLGLDVFITGESSHTIYHYCLEAGMNVIFGGHYQTEVRGVASLARHLREQCGLETVYFDHPTGL